MLLPRKDEEIRKEIFALKESMKDWNTPEARIVLGLCLIAEIVLDKDYPLLDENDYGTKDE